MSQTGFNDKPTPMGRTPKAAAYRIFYIYLLVGFAWILLSDIVVTNEITDEYWHGVVDTAKGLAYVFVTGLLIKWLLQRELDARDKTAEDLRFFSQLTEVSNDPIFVVDPAEDFKLVYVNTAAEKHFKTTKEKLLSMRVQDWNPRATPEKTQNALLQCRTKGFFFFESTHRRADGTFIPVEVLLNLIVYHGREYLGGYFRDVSERKQAEERLAEQSRMLELILNTVPQAVFWKDTHSRYLGCNRIFAQAAGMKTPLEIVGKTDFDLPWVQLEAHGYVADDQKVIASREARHNIIEPVTTATGTKRWLETSKIPLLSPDGTVLGVLGVFEDITERRQAQEALRLNEQLFSGVFNSSLDALFLVDWNTRLIQNCNGRALSLFEAMHKSEVVGQAGFTWHRTKRDPDVSKQAYEVVAQGGEWTEEVEYTTLKGNHFWGLLAARKLDLPTGQTALIRITDITSLKQMELQLRQERDFSRWIIDALPGVFYVLEADGRLRSWNKQLEKVTGLTGEQLKGISCLKLLHTDDHAHVVAAIERALMQGEEQADARIVCTAGNSHPYHFHGRRIELDGRPCILGIGIDMLEREEMEAQLEHQLQFQMTLMDSMPIAVFTKDANGRYLSCNRAFEQFTNLTRDKIAGKTVSDVFDPELSAICVLKDRELLKGLGTQVYEGRIKQPSGVVRDVIFHKASFLDANGQIGGIIGAFIDITEAKRAHERLLLQESALRAAANSIVITDRKGAIVWANPAFTALTGYTPEEVIGQTPRVLKSGRQTDQFYHELWQTILKGNVWRGELTNKRKDGSIYDEDMTITPVRDAAGNVTHFVAIKQDVTQRKQLEAQYLRAQRMEGIGMLAGGIAHDLNNVLAPIIMSIQILKELHPDDDTAEILVGLQDSAQRGADIVRQVLTFARGIKGERLLLTPKHLVKDMVRVAKEAFPRNITISSDVADDLWNVMGDPTQLHQVLLNLCVNARDAMPDGGMLTVNAYNTSLTDGTGVLGTKMAAGDYTVLSVKDSGMGIPYDIQERIFEPFFTTKDQGKGTGLGLSTVMGIVKSHHGYIRLLSEPGKGAEFQIYLPAIKTGERDLKTEPQNTLPEGHGELVMLVDDEEMIRMVGKDILSRHGYRVILASDGTEAMALMAQQIGKVHLVITDIMMPYMDGVALVRGLRKMAPEVKILACSGLASGASMTNKVDELKRLGVHPILHKPFTARKLLVNVNHVLHDEPIETEGI
jgi:two-component system cell cycle sensor histidine kinase/response regulator CckA